MKKTKLLITGVIILAALAIACCGIFFSQRNKIKTVTDDAEVEKNIVEVEFPESGGGEDVKVTVDDKVSGATFDDEMYFYKMNVEDSTLAKKVAKYHKLDDKQILKQNDDYIDGAYMKTYDNGTIMLDLKISTNNSITKSDEECCEIADDYLKNIGIDKDEYTYSKFSYDNIQGMEDGSSTSTNRKTVYYNRVIDGKEILGDVAMYVSIVDDGKVDKFYCANTVLSEKYMLSDKNVNDYKKCLDDLKEKRGYVSVPEEADEISIDNVDLAYWGILDPYADDWAIVPVYKFSGKALQEGKVIGDVVICEKIIEK